MTTFTTQDRIDAERNDLLEKIRKQEEEIAELKRLFNKAMDEWEKERKLRTQ
jgi:hypothetical protein